MNQHSNTINFKNGYIDVSTRKFRKKTLHEPTLDYNWVNPSKDVILKVGEFIENLFDSNESKMSVLSFFALCLVGVPVNKVLYLWGMTDTGKTTLLHAHMSALGIYTHKLSIGFMNRNIGMNHRELYHILGEPTRLVFADNLDSTAINTTLLKKMTERYNIVLVSNGFPKFDKPEIISNMGLSHQCTNSFLSEEEYERAMKWKGKNPNVDWRPKLKRPEMLRNLNCRLDYRCAYIIVLMSYLKRIYNPETGRFINIFNKDSVLSNNFTEMMNSRYGDDDDE